MDLTNETFAGYVGGQAEIQNSIEGFMLRGEIQTIVLDGEDLTITFAWMAKFDEVRWVKSDTPDYRTNISMYSVNNIGSSGGDVGGGDRLCLQCGIIGETMVLFPPDGSKLDRAKVEGLEPASV